MRRVHQHGQIWAHIGMDNRVRTQARLAIGGYMRDAFAPFRMKVGAIVLIGELVEFHEIFLAGKSPRLWTGGGVKGGGVFVLTAVAASEWIA